ncbi:hypothetical protein [Clostridium sp. Marseille-P299]|uniref:hypothetical protein n=1 Tax=Clostridium sp. Marseille-P299 TaxID=1805477 RepID=UPI0008376B06|nr:hypothetical protein [Clostridium sp. Marseille-P299]
MKETRLDDSASIYERRNPKTERQKLSEMNGKEKWQYYKDYYLKKTIMSTILIAFVAYFLYTVLSPKPETVLHVACANYQFSEEQIEQLEQGFGEYLGINTDKQDILFDPTYILSDFDYTSTEKLSILAFAGELDVLIVPESKFKEYAFSGSLWSLSDQLPTDLYSALSDKFYLSQLRQDEESMEEATGPSYVFGIYLDDTELFKGYSKEDPPVLGIVLSSSHNENAVEFIRYLFNINP